MHDAESHSDPVLKVSDRRHFTESGELRPGIERSTFEEVATPAAAAAPAPSASAPSKPSKPVPEAAPRLSKREVNLEDLLQQLYSVGLMQLGAEIQPGQRGQVDLEGAAGTIDLLGVLEQKTHGNLDPQEERLLASILYDLRLGYVEVQRASNRVQPAVVAPPPPPARSRR